MITLTIDNSYSKIEGLSIVQYKELSDLLSYDLDPQANYFAGGHRPTKRTLLGKKGDFPSGLLYIVLKWLKMPYTAKDLRKRPARFLDRFKLNMQHTPYDFQSEAVAACLGASRGTCSMVTGSGKSITMALLIHSMQVKTLVVVPNLGLKQQLTETFRQLFGNTKDIVVENIDSSRLETLTDFDMLLIDESHHVAASTYRRLNKKYWNKIFYRYFFTGTAFRSREEEQLLMESISGQVIYSVDYHKAVEVGAIVPIEAYYIELPKQEVEGYTWGQVYSELVVNNKHRNGVIAELLTNLHSAGQSILCLVKEVAHGEALSKLTGAAFAHGQNEETPLLIEGFNSKTLRCLIGTTGVLGEGVDTKPAEWVIIAGLGKSKNSFMQQVGRGFRVYPGKESCKIIIFLDKSHRWAKVHFKAQCKILLDKYGIKPVKLDL